MNHRSPRILIQRPYKTYTQYRMAAPALITVSGGLTKLYRRRVSVRSREPRSPCLLTYVPSEIVFKYFSGKSKEVTCRAIHRVVFVQQPPCRQTAARSPRIVNCDLYTRPAPQDTIDCEWYTGQGRQGVCVNKAALLQEE